MAGKSNVQIRVAPAFAKLVKRIAREETRAQRRPVGIPEVTRHLEAYLHDPLDGRCWWRPLPPELDPDPIETFPADAETDAMRADA